MKKLFISLLAVTALFTSCNNAGNTQLQVSNDSLRVVVAEKDMAINELVNTMNIVEEGFRMINEMQGRINTGSPMGEVGYAETLQSDIEAITNTLAKNKEEIEKLKKQLNSNSKASKELKAKVADLEAQLLAKGQELGKLMQALAEKDIHINKLDSVIANLTRTNAGQEERLMEQEIELNSVWYAIGTKKELKEQNILSKGFLKKATVMRESDVNYDYFTNADKRTLTTINTHSKSAKLLSNHPEGSYTLEQNEEKQQVLTITSPNEFWSTTRYLIIQVK